MFTCFDNMFHTESFDLLFFFQKTARTSAISSPSLLVAGFPEHASLTTFAAILETFELLFPSYPAHTLPSVYFLQLCVGLCADIPKYLAKFDTNSLLSFLCHSHWWNLYGEVRRPHATHFSSNTAINNGNEHDIYNLVWIRDKMKCQSMPRRFIRII